MYAQIDVSVVPHTEVVGDVGAAWRTLNHSNAVKGHTRVGLSNSLDGEEDVLIAREAAMFGRELQMPWLRAEAIKEVREAFASGDLTWETVRSVSVSPSTNCEHVEGMEFAGELAPHEPAWETAEDPFPWLRRCMTRMNRDRAYRA